MLHRFGYTPSRRGGSRTHTPSGTGFEPAAFANYATRLFWRPQRLCRTGGSIVNSSACTSSGSMCLFLVGVTPPRGGCWTPALFRAQIVSCPLSGCRLIVNEVLIWRSRRDTIPRLLLDKQACFRYTTGPRSGRTSLGSSLTLHHLLCQLSYAHHRGCAPGLEPGTQRSTCLYASPVRVRPR